MGKAAKHLARLVEDIAYLESRDAPKDDDKGPHGWSAKDSYEDAVMWARYYASQIINKGC